MRVMQVKNHYMTKESYTEAGYFDGSLEEKSKREGDLAVKRLIDSGLDGSSVLCVLIGAQASQGLGCTTRYSRALNSEWASSECESIV